MSTCTHRFEDVSVTLNENRHAVTMLVDGPQPRDLDGFATWCRDLLASYWMAGRTVHVVHGTDQFDIKPEMWPSEVH